MNRTAAVRRIERREKSESLQLAVRQLVKTPAASAAAALVLSSHCE